jgi:hypothetical protein
MYLGGTEAHDALSMYIQEGSQEWTDYRFQARVNLVSGVDIGVWFRGTFVNEGGGNGRKLTGYYFLLDPLHDTLALWQMQTDEECTDCTANYSFSNPMTLVTLSGVPLYLNHWYTIKVEVAGPLIKCYVDDALKIEYNDTVGTTFLQGTVGLFVYKASDARFDDILVESL